MLLTEPRVLWRLLLGQPAHGPLAQRLDRFYGPQAARYDATREGLLHGRRALTRLLAPRDGDVVVELGAGTGALPEQLGARAARCRRVYLVDLCKPMLEVARERNRLRENVEVVEADAVAFRPREAADVVVFSYALTMIPDWYAALGNALAMLRPGGTLAVTDFHVSRRVPPPGLERHGALARALWPMWFDHDGVRLQPDLLPWLLRHTEPGIVIERRGRVPGLPFRAPYFVFTGRKPAPTRHLVAA